MRTEAAPGPPLDENYLGFPEGQGGQRLLDLGCIRAAGCDTRNCDLLIAGRATSHLRTSFRSLISSMNAWAICCAVEGRGAGALI
jgi:hypothetical protein